MIAARFILSHCDGPSKQKAMSFTVMCETSGLSIGYLAERPLGWDSTNNVKNDKTPGSDALR
jgi:hypothetical protein